MLPSHNEGIFARAMTTVESKANERAQGVFGSGVNEGQKQETSVLAWAIAQKYMLSSAQQFNEKTLKTVLKNKGACAFGRPEMRCYYISSFCIIGQNA